MDEHQSEDGQSESEDDGVSSSTEFQWLSYLSDKDSEEDRVNLRAERLYPEKEKTSFKSQICELLKRALDVEEKTIELSCKK